MRGPQVEPAAGLPDEVRIYEVGPRDGLQNEPTVVPAAVIGRVHRRLAAAGLPVIRRRPPFVPPSWVPAAVRRRRGARAARP